jgi:hypothetical protein
MCWQITRRMAALNKALADNLLGFDEFFFVIGSRAVLHKSFWQHFNIKSFVVDPFASLHAKD